MTLSPEFELGWIVGVMEGEGHIGFSGRRMNVVVSNNDMWVLKEFKRIVGCGEIYRSDGKCAVWKTRNVDESLRVVNMLYKFLSPRRRTQAMKVISRGRLNVKRIEGGVCRNGHDLVGENFVVWGGRPYCRMCQRQWKQQARAKKSRDKLRQASPPTLTGTGNKHTQL